MPVDGDRGESALVVRLSGGQRMMNHEGSLGRTTTARSPDGYVPEVRIAVDVETAAEMLGVSRGALYPLVMAGDVPSFKIGRRRLVLVEKLRSWAVSQVDAAETLPATPPR